MTNSCFKASIAALGILVTAPTYAQTTQTPSTGSCRDAGVTFKDINQRSGTTINGAIVATANGRSATAIAHSGPLIRAGCASNIVQRQGTTITGIISATANGSNAYASASSGPAIIEVK